MVRGFFCSNLEEYHEKTTSLDPVGHDYGPFDFCRQPPWQQDSVEEALGEIDIYNGGTELSYLDDNGRVRTLIYTY